MEFQCIAEGQNSRGLTINVKKSDQPPLVLVRFPPAVTLLMCAMISPNSILLILSFQGIHEKINKLRIKILRKKPAIPFLDKKNARLRGR
jgi:hypothetical protein